MINTIRYGGTGEVERDGEKITVPIPPSAVLSQAGPFIQATIRHPRVVEEKLKAQGKEAPAVTVRALIDTGASSSVIAPAVAEQLGLVHTGYQKVSSVQDEQEQPVYYGFMLFPWGSGKEIPIVACPLRGIECLIGRDILMHWHLSYNGSDGSIVICD